MTDARLPRHSSNKTVYTIGHSTHPIGRFIELLRRHGVTAVADVRSAPSSRFNPQFNRKALLQSLHDAAISYVFLGAELGARTRDPCCYESGRVSYEKLARTPSFRSGLERLEAGSKTHVIALMCAEKDPLKCHRTILVARELETMGLSVAHILDDGSLEPHRAAMHRLIQQLRISDPDLFRSNAALLEEAYKIQSQRIAYVQKDRGVASKP